MSLILYVRKLRFRDGKYLTQGQTGGLLLTQTSNPGCLTPAAIVLTMTFPSVAKDDALPGSLLQLVF